MTETAEQRAERVSGALEAVAGDQLPEPAPGPDYEHMKAAELRELLDERGITGVERRSKAMMVIALREADEQASAEGEPEQAIEAEAELAPEQEADEDPEADPETELVDPETLTAPDQMQEVKRPLHVLFDEARLRDILEEFSDTYTRLRSVEFEMASANSDWRAEIKELKKEADRLHGILRTGGEQADVTCRETLHFREGIAVVVRLDTGEVVESRPLTADERQVKLELEQGEQPHRICPDCGLDLVPREEGDWYCDNCGQVFPDEPLEQEAEGEEQEAEGEEQASGDGSEVLCPHCGQPAEAREDGYFLCRPCMFEFTGSEPEGELCPECNGTGQREGETCPACKGTGLAPEAPSKPGRPEEDPPKAWGTPELDEPDSP